MLKRVLQRLFRFTLLKSVLAVSVLAVLTLPVYVSFFAYPAIMHHLKRAVEDESLKVASHLASMFITEKVAIERAALIEKAAELEKVKADFGLMKLKVFMPSGEIAYSTDPKDIGHVNVERYFHEEVARGKTISKVVRKEKKTLEGEAVMMDVVETYVPIMSEGRFIGAFEIYYDITKEMEDLNTLVMRAGRVLAAVTLFLIAAAFINYLKARSNILARIRAEEQLNRKAEELRGRNEDLSLLFNISASVSRKLELEELLKLVLDTVTEPVFFGVERKGGIFLVDGEKMRLAAHLGHPEEFIRRHVGMKVGDCLCGLAAKTGELIVSKNSSVDRRHVITYAGMSPHGHVVVPLTAMEKLVGVLYLYLPPDFEIEDRRLQLLHSVGSLVGVAIENAKLYESTRDLSLQDPLTGLANRRLMGIVLENSFGRAERYGSPLSAAMVDIDYFKKYNDTYGHAAGDRLLVEIAGILRKSVRGVDLVVRYGGEEFLLLIHETSFEQSCAVVERIRNAIEQITAVTVSIGLAAYRPGMKKEELIEKADVALYRAKEGGRNRAVCT